jgi:hypothetical protein
MHSESVRNMRNTIEIPMQLNDQGNLEPLTESCITHANRIYKERYKKDTDPVIAQMILYGELVPHWYYRSMEWIDQPLYDLSKLLAPYRGPAQDVNPGQYGEGTYKVDEISTQIALMMAEGRLPSF